MEVLSEFDYLEGSRLVQALQTRHPEVLQRAKASLGGSKGWLKALLTLEPRIEAVEVPDRNEPCYRFADNPDGLASDESGAGGCRA
mmetsp:Transcript_167818/g.533614  ORF Transcript_167818/g.533614 Transcript_167818/m.533614 type:complete len:86 (-) Transcript_167818:72-329(-)